MKRIFLFLATNLAILVVLSVSMWVLGLFFPGLSQALNADGGINMSFLLVMAAILGMGGAFISLAISKWSAKRMTGAYRHQGVVAIYTGGKGIHIRGIENRYLWHANVRALCV